MDFYNNMSAGKLSSLDAIITKAMLQMGFSPANNGYYFLRDSIKLAYIDPEAATLITKLIYAPIAKSYDTTSENIEKSIRLCVKKVWEANTKNGTGKTVAVLNNSYTFTEHRPENKEIINLLCSFVKQAADIFDADISDSI